MISTPTLKFRWRKAAENESVYGKPVLPIVIGAGGLSRKEYYILEQQHRITSVDSVELVWVAVPVIDEGEK